MNDPTSALQQIPVVAVVGPFLTAVVAVLTVTVRAFIQAQKAQGEVNAEKNRTIERQGRELEAKDREIERLRTDKDAEISYLRGQLDSFHDRETAKDMTIQRLRSDLRRLDPSGG